jgi:hypothetical protein
MAEHKHNLELSRRLDRLGEKQESMQMHESAAVRMLRSLRNGLESAGALIGATHGDRWRTSRAYEDEDLDNVRAWLQGTMAELDAFLAIKPAADAPETDKPDNG